MASVEFVAEQIAEPGSFLVEFLEDSAHLVSPRYLHFKPCHPGIVWLFLTKWRDRNARLRTAWADSGSGSIQSDRQAEKAEWNFTLSA